MLQFNKGLFYRDLAIDSLNGHTKKFNLVTHAHSDHFRPLKKLRNIYVSKETRDLILRENSFLRDRTVVLKNKNNLENHKIELLNAGHILGSSQFLLDNKLLVTGDICFEDSLLFKRADVVETENLVIEATFGSPDYVFPERKQIYSNMVEFVETNIQKNNLVVFGGYSLGKNQELIALLNKMGIEPGVSERTAIVSEVYNKNGFNLKFHKTEEANNEEVLVVSSSHLSSDLVYALQKSLRRKVVPALCTGWAQNAFFSSRLRNFYLFPLSSHADFSQLLSFVQEVKPKQVFTYYGFDKELAFYIQRKLRIPARPLNKSKEQTFLTEFL